MPAGVLETVPEPVPGLEMDSLCFSGTVKLKVAVNVFASFMETVHWPVLEHPLPDQPVKLEPEVAEAVRVTEVPLGKDAWHVDPQSISLKELVTAPEPVPSFEIDKL